VLVGKVKKENKSKSIALRIFFTSPTTFKIIARYPTNRKYRPTKIEIKTAKAREMKKNWPRIDQKAKKEFSKIRGYIFIFYQ
jgi:hypothetical protein